MLYGLWVSENPLQQNVQPAVFFMVMFAEYFSLVYCRSKTTIRYFPRFFCLGFLTLHLYLLASPNGYYGIASAVYGCFTVFLALHFVRVYEVPALRAGEVSETQPRAFVVRVRHSCVKGHALDA